MNQGRIILTGNFKRSGLKLSVVAMLQDERHTQELRLIQTDPHSKAIGLYLFGPDYFSFEMQRVTPGGYF
jgi:hypothetical protein